MYLHVNILLEKRSFPRNPSLLIYGFPLSIHPYLGYERTRMNIQTYIYIRKSPGSIRRDLHLEQTCSLCKEFKIWVPDFCSIC